MEKISSSPRRPSRNASPSVNKRVSNSSSLQALVNSVDKHTSSRRESEGRAIAAQMLNALKLAYDDNDKVNPEGAAAVVQTYVSSQKGASPANAVATPPMSPMPVVNPSRSAHKPPPGSVRSCRIYDMNAINAPGVIYKAIAVYPHMSARDLIVETLEKVGSSANPDRFELRFAPDLDTIHAEGGKKKKKNIEPSKLLQPNDCPTLVVEWYTDIPRRFEVHPRTSDPEKMEKRWAEYWHAPSSFNKKSSRRSSDVQKSVRRSSSASPRTPRRRTSLMAK